MVELILEKILPMVISFILCSAPGSLKMYHSAVTASRARLATVKFLENFPSPTDEDIDAHHTNICRCGSYEEMRRAIHMAARLQANGADFLVIPCNTAYVFEDAILAATHVPLISIIGVSIAAAQERAKAYIFQAVLSLN